MTERLHLTCCCGATLDLSVEYSATLRLEREKFDEAHQVCRDRGPQTPSCSGVRPAFRIVPAPPDKPTPLPNPVVPSP